MEPQALLLTILMGLLQELIIESILLILAGFAPIHLVTVYSVHTGK